MRKLRGAIAAVLVIAAAGAVAPSAAAAPAVVMRSANEPEYSFNWSGYAVGAKPGEQITEVRGSWTVPKVKLAPPGFSSSWIGIGGFSSADLIQVGTASSGRIE